MKSLRNIAFVVLIQTLFVQSLTISPKLDFGDGDVIKVKKEISVGKIKGLRVTVDTSELKESKSSGSESSSSSESSEKKKTVGVRTDVTFEITSTESNDTRTVDDKEVGKDDDNNASIPIVPVFKGTDRGSSSQDGSKDPNFNDLWSVKPLDNPSPGSSNIPNPYDDRNRYGPSDSQANQYPQYAIWTTERYNRKHDQPVYHHRGPYDIHQRPPSNFVPYHMNHDRHPPWQPCACKEYPGPYINPQQPSAERVQKVDDKLDRPFSKTL